MELTYTPRILLCGDEAKFLSQCSDRPVQIIGHTKLYGEIDGQKFNFGEDGKIFFNDKLQDFDALKNFLTGGDVDYLLFTEFADLAIFRNYSFKHGFISTKVTTLAQFKVLPREFFYDLYAERELFLHLKNSGVKTLLDADGYFLRGALNTKEFNDFTEIDCITNEPVPPIKENIYTHVYKNFAEVGFKRYDAALLIERRPIDFDATFVMLENFTDCVIIFTRTNSEPEKHFVATLKNFEQITGFRSATGNWFFVRRHRKPENFCVYVVTYKDLQLAEPPEGYKIIHAGRGLSKDIGYDGDNTGDNISSLNVYLNELTALYWMWKNTTHTVVGLNHYRRFFTESPDTSFAYEKILTKDAALKLLERYDFITSTATYEILTQRELIKNDCKEELTTLAENVFRKHLIKAQPDYLPAFEEVMNALTIYRSHLFITRRNIFDAYCKWLFSFLLDATDEILRTADLANLPFTPRRLIAFFAERMLTVWLQRNRMRIKELNFMFIKEL